MAYLYARAVTYSEFTQRVRRYDPASLLVQVAGVGAKFALPGSWLKSPYQKMTPWALAEVARVAIVSGNSHRPRARIDDVLKCCAAHAGLTDPELHADAPGGLSNFLLRLISEQVSYQLSPREEIARSISLFKQTHVASPLEVLIDGWEKEVLGGSLEEYLSAGFLILAAGLAHDGQFTFDRVDQASFAHLLEDISLDAIREVTYRSLTANAAEIRKLDAVASSMSHPDLQRFRFNPFEARPVLDGLVQPLLIPVPGLLTRKLSPNGIYYMGLERYGEAFSRDVGTLFEAFVGQHLKQMSGAIIHPEIKYKVGRETFRSIDWIAVFDDVTLLVEVKATRPNQAVRTGGSDGSDANESLQRALAKAYRQIERTAVCIRQENPAFESIPSHKPIIGLVVTMESFHVVNAPPYSDLMPRTSVPTRVCAASELERLVTIGGSTVGRFLQSYMDDPNQQDSDVHGALLRSGLPRGINPIVENAWESISWFKVIADNAKAIQG